MTHCHISNLLEKMLSPDKDFRFMATNDLMSELQKPSIKLDDEIERKIVKMLLCLLEDKNGEVQNLAVKCLGPLVNKVKHIQVELIVETLCKNMVCDNDQLRDISSIGLKTVIIELPKSSSESISTVCNKITDKLTDVIQKNSDVPVQLEALDILSDLLNRFGSQLENYYTSIQEALLPLLQSQRLAVRKRSITALSYLCTTCEPELFDKTINFLLTQLTEKSSDINLVSTYIQCIAAISRLSGHKLGNHLETMIPMIINLSSYNDDELKEYCIQAFDAFIRKAPKEITQYVPLIIEISLKYLCHDPNYNYDENEDEEMELDNDFESESNDEYSDDDDMSWKVRRASAKCLEAIISTRHEMLIDIHKTISSSLIARYKEREENVKVDIFNAYIALLKQTKNYVANYNDTDSPISLLEKQVPNIIKTIHKQLKEKSVKTRQGSFNLLIELITVLPGCLKDHLETLVPGILYSLNDKNSTSNMKIDTLVFFNTLLKTHPPEVFHPHLNLLLSAVISSVDDSFYKISSEALVVLIQMIKIVRPGYGETQFSSCIQPIYNCTYLKLKASDLDQEVKERAIACMGQLIHTFGDLMQNELNIALTLLVERLKNEITRLTTIKAFTLIASSPFKINFAPYLGDALPILAGFLRKNQRNLKINSLILLDTLVKNYGDQIQPHVIEIILNELPHLVNESDLYISQLTLNLLTTLIKLEKGYFEVITGKVLQETLILIRSPLLQGTALQSILDFFQALVIKPFPNFSFDQLLSSLKEPVYIKEAEKSVNLHKQAYHSIAKCVSAISIVDKTKAFNTVSNLMMDIINYKNFDNIQSFALLAIGEIGKNVDLSSFTDLKELLLSALNSTSEEVKSSASFALGSISVGNLQEYLPFVLQKIEIRDRRQYLILHSLKEIISCQSINPVMIQTLKPHLDSIWSLLLNHCQCPEEGTRNVVAECLGKLIIMNPEELLPKLQSYLTHNNPLARSTVVTAMKFTISEQPQSVDVLLKQCIGEFLKSLEDEDLNVRRVALVAFNSAAHNKPSLVRDLLDQVLPLLYKETKIKKELIREVEMGPFKHSVDDGLDIRKAAFECMYTLLDSCLDKIDIFEFLNHVESGLKDHYDIRMLTFLMLIRLTVLRPTAVLNRIDKLVESLKDICTEKYKSNAVKQENEKLEELKRSAMRAFLSLLTIPDADKNITVSTFYSSIKNNEELQKLYDQIQSDNINLSGDANAAMEIN